MKPTQDKGSGALIELAERCEKATGPDRELNALIATAVGWRQLSEAYDREAGYWISPSDIEAKRV